MKNQVLKMISTLSLFVALTLGARNVFAFPGGCGAGGCLKPSLQYSLSTTEQTVLEADAAVSATSQPSSSVDPSTFIWAQLALFLASLL